MKPVIAKGNEVHEEDFWIMYKKMKAMQTKFNSELCTTGVDFSHVM